ncbi:hypothetical protein B0H66DRAFT_466680 [Apodospora peruviana]|uniref:Uncharacterized protein n=1 Tax=Apodospora peruviana TaxID=516989 RepID=A0AAE0ME53_9PEZI|nr:hypothetical protein B0H66DRAFT_466680 [Apodospora peruviana]
MASYAGQSGVGGTIGKITKTRGKVKVVKPILKKLSHSEKNSLDLDRGWEEQSVEQLDNDGFLAGDGGSGAGSGAGAGTIVGGGAGGSSSSRGKFQHGRSASQASTGSGPRGAFVHPFQQMPRTATPPLSRSYANSLASFDNGPRDYSPTITETEDDAPTQPNSQSRHVIHGNSSNSIHHNPPNLSQQNLRRPSLASQRTSSFSDIAVPVALPRVNTGLSSGAARGASSSRLAHGIATASHSDLHLNLSLSGGLDSPTGSLGGTLPQPSLASPTSSVSAAPMSPLRSSLDATSFPRLRSRSELDSAARAESIRTARRKFEERERAKEEKYDREMIKKRERRDTKEASRIEREAAARKGSMSGSEAVRPSASRKTTPTDISIPSVRTCRSGGPATGANTPSRHDTTAATSFWNSPVSSAPGTRRNTNDGLGSYTGEKEVGFAARKYESVPPSQTLPAFGIGVDDVRFEPSRPRRSSTAKRKTQGYWQGFVLWLRTKLLRLSGK